jgi:hypothetical protein
MPSGNEHASSLGTILVDRALEDWIRLKKQLAVHVINSRGRTRYEKPYKEAFFGKRNGKDDITEKLCDAAHQGALRQSNYLNLCF